MKEELLLWNIKDVLVFFSLEASNQSKRVLGFRVLHPEGSVFCTSKTVENISRRSARLFSGAGAHLS